jgi:hypothetical protein
VVENPALELNIHLRPNFVGDLAEGARIQFGGAIIRVERFHAKGGKGKAAALAAARRASHYDHSRSWQRSTAEVGTRVFTHVLGEFALQEVSFFINDAKADRFVTLFLVNLIALGQNVTHQRVEFAIVVHIDGFDRQWLDGLHLGHIICQFRSGTRRDFPAQFDLWISQGITFVIRPFVSGLLCHDQEIKS